MQYVTIHYTLAIRMKCKILRFIWIDRIDLGAMGCAIYLNDGKLAKFVENSLHYNTLLVSGSIALYESILFFSFYFIFLWQMFCFLCFLEAFADKQQSGAVNDKIPFFISYE